MHDDSMILKQMNFSAAHKEYRTTFSFLEEHAELIRGAKKNWGLKKDQKHYYETFNYFDEDLFPPRRDVSGGHIDFSEGIILEKINQCVVETHFSSPDNTDQFTYRISQDPALPVDLYFETGFTLLCNQGEYWQHFMQDALHFLFFARDFLLANPLVPLFIYGPNDVSVLEVIKFVLGLKNPLIRLPPLPSHSKNIKFDALFQCRFLPKSHLYSCAPEMRREINHFFCVPDQKKTALSYLSRKNQNTRKVTNEQEVVSYLTQLCSRRNLDFHYWESGRFSLKETIDMMQSTQILVAPHGGANYHAYWMSPGTKFVEMVFPEVMETLMPIACSVGLDYWMLPVTGVTHHTREFTVNIAQLDTILQR